MKLNIYKISIKLILITKLVILVQTVNFAQITPSIFVTGGTAIFVNEVKYKRNYNTSLGITLPISKSIFIQPAFSTGSYKGAHTNGYFASSIDLTHLNFGYRLNFKEFNSIKSKLDLKVGLGIMKSEVLTYSNVRKGFSLVNYPFFCYYLGMDYGMNLKSDFDLFLKLDCYLTETEWLDGNPNGTNDIVISPGIGIAYNINSNKKTEEIKQPIPISNNKVNTNPSLTKEELKALMESNYNDLKKYFNERFDTISSISLDQQRKNNQNSFNINSNNNQNYLDSNANVYMPDGSVRQVKISPPSYRYSVICGAYSTLDGVVLFSDMLKNLGYDSKVIKTNKSNLFLVSVYEGDEYGKIRANMSLLRPKLEKLKIQGKLWIWDKTANKGILRF